MIDDGLRLNGTTLGGGLVADHRQHGSADSTGNGLGKFAGEGVHAIDDTVFTLPGHDLLGIDDVGNEGPHHEVEHAGAERAEEEANKENPGAVGVDDEHQTVHGGAEE